MRLRSIMLCLGAFLVAPLFSSRPAHAEAGGDDAPPARGEARSASSSVFVEVGGPGLLYSVNVDRMLTEMFSIRAGASYFQLHDLHDDHAGYVLAPIVGNLLLGGRDHKFELGVGAVPGWAIKLQEGDTSGFQLHEVVTAGYRYAPREGGVGLRANIEAMRIVGVIVPWAATSVGWNF